MVSWIASDKALVTSTEIENSLSAHEEGIANAHAPQWANKARSKLLGGGLPVKLE